MSGKSKSASFRFSPAVITGALLLTAFAVTGCANHSKRDFTVGSVPDDYRTRHPIVISEQEQTMDIPIAQGSSKITTATESSITGFVQRFGKSASGDIRVMVPSGSPNEGAAQGAALHIVELLRDEGISRERIIVAPYFAEQHGAAAPVRLSYSGIKAGVKDCGQWPDDLLQSEENKQYHNFGCASQNNLAAMISNPSDLLEPRGSTEIDAERRKNVLQKYREGEETATVRDEL